MIISIYRKNQRSPPPSPSSSPPKKQLTAGGAGQLRADNYKSPLTSPRPSGPIILMTRSSKKNDPCSVHQSSTSTSQGDHRQLTSLTTMMAESSSRENMAKGAGRRSPPPPPRGGRPIVPASSLTLHVSKWKNMWSGLINDIDLF